VRDLGLLVKQMDSILALFKGYLGMNISTPGADITAVPSAEEEYLSLLHAALDYCVDAVKDGEDVAFKQYVTPPPNTMRNCGQANHRIVTSTASIPFRKNDRQCMVYFNVNRAIICTRQEEPEHRRTDGISDAFDHELWIHCMLMFIKKETLVYYYEHSERPKIAMLRIWREWEIDEMDSWPQSVELWKLCDVSMCRC
jgi:hypothetical protein